MVVQRNGDFKSINIFQAKYLTSIQKILNMFDCKPMSIPLEVRLKLNNNMSPIDSKDIEAKQRSALFYQCGMPNVCNDPHSP
jgi:hypothetical protein